MKFVYVCANKYTHLSLKKIYAFIPYIYITITPRKINMTINIIYIITKLKHLYKRSNSGTISLFNYIILCICIFIGHASITLSSYA